MDPVIEGMGIVRVDEHDQHVLVGTVFGNTEGEWVGKDELKDRLFHWVIPDDKQLWRLSPKTGGATDLKVSIAVQSVEIEEIVQEGGGICRIGIISGPLITVQTQTYLESEE